MDKEFSNRQYFKLLTEGKYHEAEDYRRLHVPHKLYKFVWLEDDSKSLLHWKIKERKSNSLKFSALQNNYLWLSHVKQLNDPYEYKCMYVNKEKFRKAGYSDEIIATFENILQDNMNQMGVTCFSEKEPENNMPMWDYYANNGRGFCIEYEVISPNQIHKVFYEPDRIPLAIILTDMMGEFYKNKKGLVMDESKMEFCSNVIIMQLFMKHTSWQHEQEYRLVYPLSPGTTGCKVGIMGAGLKVNRIIAGMNCSKEHRDILNTISNELGCGDIYHVAMSQTSFISLVRRGKVVNNNGK